LLIFRIIEKSSKHFPVSEMSQIFGEFPLRYDKSDASKEGW
jgi:hypothetical protein